MHTLHVRSFVHPFQGWSLRGARPVKHINRPPPPSVSHPLQFHHQKVVQCFPCIVTLSRNSINVTISEYFTAVKSILASIYHNKREALYSRLTRPSRIVHAAEWILPEVSRLPNGHHMTLVQQRALPRWNSTRLEMSRRT